MQVLPCGDDDLYHGFVRLSNGNQYRICMVWNSDAQRQFYCEPELEQLLVDVRHLLLERLDRAESPGLFIDELTHVFETRVAHKLNGKVEDFAKLKRILKECEKIGWDKVKNVKEDFGEIEVETRDLSGRKHWLVLTLNHDQSVVCAFDLPVKMEEFVKFEEAAQSLEISTYYPRFEQLVFKFQRFWDIMDDIDANCWVIEPERPSRSCTMRRIIIGKNASMLFYVDPNRPSAPIDIGQCRFYGTDQILSPLKQKLAFYLSNGLWNNQESLRKNIENAFGTSLPSREFQKIEEFGLECGICYSFLQNDVAPDQNCDNSLCSRPFHRKCLFEWLKSLPTSRTSFDTVFGTCPYCFSPITVSER
jgi:E3 ubiquitin-protein ligase FANCL